MLCYGLGIFGYLNYLLPQSRKHILELLIKGLFRLEYRGYDSAGVAFDSNNTLDDESALLQTEYVTVLLMTRSLFSLLDCPFTLNGL